MMRSTILAALAAVPVTLATDFTVNVGPNGQLIYYPEYVIAEVGDTVNMIFNPKNHTVTQSSFDTPCVPLAGGFSSGFKPVASLTDGELPNFVITVNDTNPIWVHCEQTGHCGQGMVFAINPPSPEVSNNTFAAFQLAAIKQNGTTSSAAPTTTFSSQSWATATATVSDATSTWVSTYTSYAGTPEPTFSPTGPVTHNITVGINGQLQFGPANISAAIGDIVQFTFLAKNHSVVQSSFLNPCTPLANGFNLGFHPVAANTTGPSLSITINDTAPIWGYCAQTSPVSHCGSGMVFAINAVESGANNFAAFLGLAEATLTNPNTTSDEGTGGGTASGASSPSSTNGASLMKVGNMVATLGFIAVVACLL
jgi:plastocyanin